MSDVAECRTADDVRQAASRVSAFRRSFAEPSWFEKRNFAALVNAAYPQKYEKSPDFETLVLAAYPAYYPGPGQHSCRGILNAISWKFQISTQELLSPRRQAHLVQARQIGWGLCRQLTGFSFPEIANVWRKDHTTVLHGCRKVKPIIDAVANRIPTGASTDHWVIEAHKVADDFPELYPFANCGLGLASIKNLRRVGRAG